jgi:hypothetical protein
VGHLPTGRRKWDDVDIAALDRSVERGVVSTISAAWRHKLVFAITGLLVFSGLAVAVLAIRPVYEASTLMVSGQASLEIASPNARQSTESPLTLTRIAESEEVLRAAIVAVGPASLAPQTDPGQVSTIDRMRSALFGTEAALRRAAGSAASTGSVAPPGHSARSVPRTPWKRRFPRHGTG